MHKILLKKSCISLTITYLLEHLNLQSGGGKTGGFNHGGHSGQAGSGVNSGEFKFEVYKVFLTRFSCALC